MSVEVGSLKYVSSLDNSDFQAKSLQDIRLIRERLALTGDVSGIEKYNEALKASAAAEEKIRAELAAILKEAQVQTEQLVQTVKQPVSGKTVFSDSAAEVAAYVNALNGLESSEGIVAGLNAQMDALVIKTTELNSQFQAGAISEAEYTAAMDKINIEQSRLVQNIQQVNDSFSKNILVQSENVVATTTETKAVEEQIGILEALKITLTELKSLRVGATNPVQLGNINKQIQETEAEIKRFSNVGKVGYDQFGQAVQNTETKQGKFAATLSRVTNLQNIGSRIVTQFTRQIIGLGVGFISLEIGAKAIQKLIEYVEQLDYFTGRLDQAKQNLAAFNEFQAEANKSASANIATFKVLSAAATDVNRSMDSRIQAAEKLKLLLPDELSTTSALAIVNGKLKDSYDDITKSIINTARALSINTKLSDITKQILDADLQIQKINNARSNELSRVKGTAQDLILGGSSLGTSSGSVTLSEQDQKNIINKRANQTIDDVNKLKKVLQGQSDFLFDFAKKNGIDLAAALEGSNKLIQKPLENFDKIIKAASDKSDLELLKNSLQAKLDSLTPGDAQITVYRTKIKQVEDLIKKLYDVKPTNDNEINSILEKRKSLLNEISTATNNIDAKQLTPDQQALTNISNTFDQLRKKIEDFNSDPKNKGIKIPLSVVSSLNKQQNKAIDNQANLNENDFIKKDIEEKKRLYADYEAYRAKVGSKIADNDFADLLKSGKDFETYLKNITAAVDKSDTSGPIQERIKLLQDAFRGLTEYQRVQLQALLIEFSTYSEKRQALIQVGIDEEKKLREKGFNQEADQVQRDTTDQLTQLDEDNFAKLDSYKKLFNNIDTLSTAEAKKLLAQLYTYAAVALATGKITKEAFDKIIKGLDSANLTINDKIPKWLKSIGSELQNIGSEVGKFDEELGNALQTIGSVVTGIGSIKSNINSLNDATKNKDIYGQISSSLGIIGTAIGVFSAVYSLFDNSKKKAEQAQYQNELQVKAIEEVNKGLERQLELTKQIYGPERITGYLKQLADIKAAEADAQAKINSRISLTGNKDLDKLISLLNDGNGNTFINQLIDGAVKTGAAVKLEGKSISDLQKLLDEGKLDEKTAALVQSLIDLQQQAIDTQNALNQDLLGTSFDDLSQSIVDLFTNVNATAEDFSNNFQKTIQTAIINSFKRQFLEKQLQGFYDDFAQLTKDAPGNVLTADDIAKLKQEYDDIISKASEQFKNIEAATGQTLGASNSANTLAGQIQASLTEATGTIIAGTLNGIELGVYNTNISIGRLVVIAQDQLAAALKIELNTRQIADNSNSLPEMLSTLKDISTSSQGSLNVALRAAGFYKY